MAADGVHGVTVIFALVDVDAAKGPTQLAFTVPFNALDPARAPELEWRDGRPLHAVFANLPHLIS